MRAAKVVAGKKATKSSAAGARATNASKVPSRKPETGGKSRRGKVGAGRVAQGRATKPKRATRAGAPTLKPVGSRKVRVVAAPVVRIAIKALDPYRKCGPETSVQFLYRVDEQVDGRITHHLVFFDRHGWYCEHGRACPAVAHARKYKGQIARVS